MSTFPDKIKHSVILNTAYPYPKLLEQFCTKINSMDGSPLLHLWCSEINTEHHIYLQVVAHVPNTNVEETLNLKIPHHFVLVISDPLPKDKVLGFKP